MAYTSAVMSTISNILKRKYLGPVRKQFAEEILVQQILKLDRSNIKHNGTGLQAEIPLHTSGSSGVGSRDELEDLPASGAQRYQKAIYTLKHHYLRIQVSGQALHATSDAAGAFLQTYKAELDGIRHDGAVEFARQTYGDGTGAIAALTDTTSGNTLVLTSAEALWKEYLYIGMKVDLGTVTDTNSLSVTPREITDVDIDAASITIDGAAVDPATTHRVYRAGNVADDGTSKEMTGLAKLIPTAANTVGGIDSTAAGFKFWKPIIDSAGGSITLSNLMKNWNKVKARGLKPGRAVALTTEGVARLLFESADFKDKVRFVDSKMSLTGGYESIRFASGGSPVELVADRLAPWGQVRFVDLDGLRIFGTGDWDYVAYQGSDVVQWVTNKHAFESALFRFADLGTDRRNTSLLMSGLTDPGF